MAPWAAALNCWSCGCSREERRSVWFHLSMNRVTHFICAHTQSLQSAAMLCFLFGDSTGCSCVQLVFCHPASSASADSRVADLLLLLLLVQRLFLLANMIYRLGNLFKASAKAFISVACVICSSRHLCWLSLMLLQKCIWRSEGWTLQGGLMSTCLNADKTEFQLIIFMTTF